MTSPKSHVYLDYAATTPVRPEVRDAMEPFLTERFGNPSSQHRWGREASAALENARASAAEALGTSASELYFVRGGTEADNLAIHGGCRALAAMGGRPTLVVSSIEHHAVLDVAIAAEQEGLARHVPLMVGRDGHVDLESLAATLSEGPALVSCMWVNNETGIVLPIEEITALAHEAGAVVHTDAVQALGKIPVHLGRVPVHLVSVSGHKLYGPKGTGLLFVRRGTTVAPLLRGGGQERALRPGTEDVAGAVGLARALTLALAEQASEERRLRALRDALERRILAALDGVRVNAGDANRAPHVSNLGFEGVDPSFLLISLDLDGVAASGASACTSGAGKGSHVIEALYGPEDGFANVRFSLGHGTSEDDIEQAADVTIEVVRRLRSSA